MNIKSWIGTAFLVAFASTSAYAFQETQVGSDAPAPATAAAPPAEQKATPGALDFSAGGKVGEAGGEGTEVSIPGLGRLGVLPKMDFGLELLYGPADVREPSVNPQDAPLEDLTIRGTVKHNF